MKLRINVEGTNYDVQVDVLPEGAAPIVEIEPEMPPEVACPPHPSDVIPADRICRSPIAGAIVAVAVEPGTRVSKDDPLVTIEAMKMQTAVGAAIAGVVKEVLVKPGDAVKPGQIICKLS